MTLQDQLDTFKEQLESGMLSFKPSHAQLETMKRATAELVESGQANRALQAGDAAPEFELEDAEGGIFNSRDFRASGPFVISFYRGVWCPYCNIELKALEAARPQFTSNGARLVAISPQTPANSRKSIRNNGLNFPILTDKECKVAATFGIRYSLPVELVELYKTIGTDLSVINDDPSWALPLPARYVIDSDGMIAYAEVSPDYTRRPDPSELLPALARLHSSDEIGKQ